MSITRTVLYYPTVQLPRGSWLNQSILYWDQIATIVPQQWDDLYNANQSYNEQNPLEYTDPTLNIFLEGQYVRAQDFNDRYITLKEHRELESEGIIRTIRPERLIQQESSKLDEFEREFLREIFYRKRKLPRIGDTKPWQKETWILQDKVSDRIIERLQKEHLAYPRIKFDHGLPNYILESNTAEIYLTFLARYLADIDSKFTVPITDVGKYWDLNYKPRNTRNRFLCARILFNLPVPQDNIPIKRILNFKSDNKDDLKKLHFSITHMEKFVGRYNDYTDLEGKCVEQAEAIMLCVNDLSQHFKDENISTITHSLCSIVNKKTVLEGMIIGQGIGRPVSLALTGNSENPVIIAASSLAAVAGKMVVEISNDWIHLKNRQSAQLRDFGFSYLFKAKSAKII